ncbi:MAG: glycosyltransferase family 4 protein [Chitinophagaceae bacterium]|nr:glycosyltransferase family 4 protein [Chitinophagaceae bacterium]
MAKVLSLVSYKIFPPKLGGQKGIALFNQFFSPYHQVICVTTKNNDPGFAKNYKLLNILSNSKFRYINIFYFFTLQKIIKQNNITHLLIEHPYYGWLGRLLQIFCKIKLIVHSHNIESLRFKSLNKWWWKILWQYEKYVHRKADLTFCITEHDRQYMLSNFGLAPAKCIVITYGIEWDHMPGAGEKEEAKKNLQTRYNFPGKTSIFLFNGTLSYPPNYDAVRFICDKLNPLLLQNDFDYKIIICGKDLPQAFNELRSYADKNIIYAGFVDDISEYFKGADVFINPVFEGGGIKTKLVEALGYNLNAVSATNGATGVDEKICNGKLFLADNAEQFAALMIKAASSIPEVPSIYFDHFYWGNIAKKAASAMDDLIS